MKKIIYKIWKESGQYNLTKEKRSYLKLALGIALVGVVLVLFVGCAKPQGKKPNMLICEDGHLYMVVPWTKKELMGAEPCQDDGVIEFMDDRLELRPDLARES